MTINVISKSSKEAYDQTLKIIDYVKISNIYRAIIFYGALNDDEKTIKEYVGDFGRMPVLLLEVKNRSIKVAIQKEKALNDDWPKMLNKLLKKLGFVFEEELLYIKNSTYTKLELIKK